ncbi:hypothetical protein AN414_19225 [Serratia marcescens]|nr:hypothetical protein AN414_19225 [Serratia marcescens]
MVGALQHEARDRARGVGADQAAVVARAPPLGNFAEGEPLVPDFHRAVGAVHIEFGAVADALIAFHRTLQTYVPELAVGAGTDGQAIVGVLILAEALRGTGFIRRRVTADADVGFQGIDTALHAVDDVFLGIGDRLGLRDNGTDLFLAQWPGGQADVDDAAVRQPGEIVTQIVVRGYQAGGVAGQCTGKQARSDQSVKFSAHKEFPC